MLALAGIPLGLSFRFLDPSPDAPAAEVGELLVGEYDDPELLDRLADGAAAVTYEFENVPVAAAERVGAIPGAAALEASQDRLVEKQLFRRLGIPTPKLDDEVEELPGDPEDAPARLRRQGTASGRDMGGVRPRSCPGGTCPVRPRAVAHRRSRGRRRHTLLPARRERPRGRDPADVARAGRGRAAGGGRGVRPSAARRARVRRRARARALRRRRPPAGERVRAARPQHRPLDDRGRRDEPVREPPPRRPRAAARLDREPRRR